MRVLVTGGTGRVGRAVLAELAGRHEVLALARTEESAARAAALGAEPLAGDLAAPEIWLNSLPPIDAVVHLAADFSAPDMGAVDARFRAALKSAAAATGRTVRVVVTGGCWLFPRADPNAAEDGAIDETAPYDPLPAFAWMVEAIRDLSTAPGIEVVTVHPGLVFDGDGLGRAEGVLGDLVAAIEAGRPVTAIGGPDVRWPLVHASDLARLYRLALEEGEAGACYHGVAVPGLPVRRLAAAIAVARGLPEPRFETLSVDRAIERFGAAAAGYGRDQRIEARAARETLGWTPEWTEERIG